jgi:hypothetical protein
MRSIPGLIRAFQKPNHNADSVQNGHCPKLAPATAKTASATNPTNTHRPKNSFMLYS